MEITLKINLISPQNNKIKLPGNQYNIKLS